MTQSTASDEPDDTIEQRLPGGRVRSWFLLGANRWLVAGIILAALFALIVTLGVVDPVPLRTAVSNSDPIETLFQALLTGLITGVTLVVTINQLVLSQELGAVGDQRNRMEGAMEFRRDVESLLERPTSPPTPSSFLQSLADLSASHGDRLVDAIEDTRDERLRDRIETYVDDLQENAASVSRRLDDAQFGTFEVIDVALDYNYSSKLYQARRFRQRESLSEEAYDALDDLVATLELFAPAREHFKTLYFQWELINLSREVLYAAIPGILVASAMILYVDDPGTITGTTLAVDNLVWVVSGAVTVALLPFVLFLSYLLRIMTVTKQTLAIGSFVLSADRDR